MSDEKQVDISVDPCGVCQGSHTAEESLCWLSVDLLAESGAEFSWNLPVNTSDLPVTLRWTPASRRTSCLYVQIFESLYKTKAGNLGENIATEVFKANVHCQN